jgi:hypothetical protein
MDVINVQNNSQGVTQYNSENGNLGYNGPGTMITGAIPGASDGNPGAFDPNPTFGNDEQEFDRTELLPVGGP